MDLSKYIGEGTLYDKKEKLEINKPKSWLKTVSAFANGLGLSLHATYKKGKILYKNTFSKKE